jgi:hypothetical protein
LESTLAKNVKLLLFAVILVLLVFLCVLWTGQSAVVNSPIDNWPMFNHDLAHTGYSTSTAPTSNHILWTFTTGGAVETSPAVVDGIVYFGSDDGYVYAVDAAKGNLIWNYSTGGPVHSSPAVADGVVFVGSDNPSNSHIKDGHNIYALDAKTGAILWTYTTGGDVYSSPAVAYGVVYVGSNDGKVYAIGSTP